VTSFAFPPGDAPTGASSDSTDNTAHRSTKPPTGEQLGRPCHTAPAPGPPACSRRHTAGGRLNPAAPPDPPAESSPHSSGRRPRPIRMMSDGARRLDDERSTLKFFRLRRADYLLKNTSVSCTFWEPDPVAVPCGCCWCVLQARFFIPASDTRQS
jgi:hypothetical protein